MDYSHHIIADIQDSIREGRGRTVGYGDREDNLVSLPLMNQYGKELCRLIEVAQKFDFSGIQSTFDDALIITADEAANEGLLRAPYPVSFFNFGPVAAMEGGQPVLSAPTIICCAVVQAVGDDMIRIRPEEYVPSRQGHRCWAISGFEAAIVLKDPGRERSSARITNAALRFRATRGFGLSNPLPSGAHGLDWSTISWENNAKNIGQYVLQALVCLAAKGIKLEQATPSRVINKLRKAKGKPPQAEHHIVVIDPERILREPRNEHGTHASPRMHWRRGHIRTLADGRKVQVHACIVGDPKAGWVTHDYEVRTSPVLVESLLD